MQAHYTTRGWSAVECHLVLGACAKLLLHILLSCFLQCPLFPAWKQPLFRAFLGTTTVPWLGTCTVNCLGTFASALLGHISHPCLGHLPVRCLGMLLVPSLGTVAVPAWDAHKFPAWEAHKFPAWERLPVPSLGTFAVPGCYAFLHHCPGTFANTSGVHSTVRWLRMNPKGEKSTWVFFFSHRALLSHNWIESKWVCQAFFATLELKSRSWSWRTARAVDGLGRVRIIDHDRQRLGVNVVHKTQRLASLKRCGAVRLEPDYRKE